MLDLFKKTEAELTPGERAGLTAIWGVLRSGLVTGLFTLSDLVAGNGHIVWSYVFYVAGSTALVTTIHSLTVLVTAPAPLTSSLPPTDAGPPIWIPPTSLPPGVPALTLPSKPVVPPLGGDATIPVNTPSPPPTIPPVQ